MLSANIGIYAWEIPRNVQLADPEFHITTCGSIHLSRALLGINRTKAYPNPHTRFFLHETRFGWKRRGRFQLAPANGHSAILAPVIAVETSKYNVSRILKWWNRPYRPLTRMNSARHYTSRRLGARTTGDSYDASQARNHSCRRQTLRWFYVV